MPFDGGDLVTAVGILVSAALAIWSLARTGGLQEQQNTLRSEQNQLAKEQNQLLKEQNEIARRQIEGRAPVSIPREEPSEGEEPVEKKEPVQAGLPARAKFKVDFRSVTRNADRIVVQNMGRQRAAAIRLELDPDRGVVGVPGDSTFPLLAPGEEWRIPFARTFGSPSRYQWTLTWVEEPDGILGRQTGWLSPP